MTRVALTVDTECKLCGGTGEAEDSVRYGDYWRQRGYRFCECVKPETIPDDGGRATLGRPGGKQARIYTSAPCRECDGRGTVIQQVTATGTQLMEQTCPRCGGSCEDR